MFLKGQEQAVNEDDTNIADEINADGTAGNEDGGCYQKMCLP